MATEQCSEYQFKSPFYPGESLTRGHLLHYKYYIYFLWDTQTEHLLHMNKTPSV